MRKQNPLKPIPANTKEFIRDCLKLVEDGLMHIEREILRFGGRNKDLNMVRLWRSDAKMRKERLLKMLEGK